MAQPVHFHPKLPYNFYDVAEPFPAYNGEAETALCWQRGEALERLGEIFLLFHALSFATYLRSRRVSRY